MKRPSPKELVLAAAGLAAGLLLLEFGLRLGGRVAAGPQDEMNAPRPGDQDAYRILALGESTTAGSRSWPFFLEGLLNEKPGRRYRVFNGAIPGTSTPFILSALEEQIERFRPHIVVAMMGINDDSGLYWTEPGPIPFFRRLRLVKFLGWVKAGWDNRGLDEPAARSNPSDPAVSKLREAWIEAGVAACEARRFDESLRFFGKAVALDPRYIPAFRRMAHCFENMGAPDADIRDFLRSHLHYLRIDDRFGDRTTTDYHYRKLLEVLRARGVRLAAMQYPTLPVAELKARFADEKPDAFIGNFANFAAALENGRYENLFIDRIGLTFGHATDAGNRLIAAAAAETVRALAEGRPPPVPADRPADRAALLRREAERVPGEPMLWIKLGEELAAAGREKEARAAADRAAAEALSPPELRRKEALLRALDGHGPEESGGFRRSRPPSQRPPRTEERRRAGPDEPEKTPAALRALLAGRPRDAGLWAELAAKLAESGDRPGALEALDRAAALALGRAPFTPHEARHSGASAPLDPATLRLVALAYQEAGELGKAAPLFDRLIESAPADARARLDKGVFDFLSGSPEKAAASLEEALRLDPGLLAAHLNLGSVRSAMGRPDTAREIFERALKLPPRPDQRSYRPLIQKALSDLP